MNKKYIDFVPTKQRKTSSAKKVVPKRVTGTKSVEKPKIERKVEKASIIEDEIFSSKEEPVYGVVEDFRPKFVKTEVEKRPLSRAHFSDVKGELAEAKATKVVTKKLSGPVEKPVEKSDDKARMKIPKSPFINQNKVTKRPLSKNVYKKVVKPTKEVPTGPVTIIAKPEQDAKISLVVTIILTIILGAAAGTIAFLLLPK